jgi:hypothetical protein
MQIFVGKRFVEDYPHIVEDFFDFQDELEESGGKIFVLPKFLGDFVMKKTIRKREKLQQCFQAGLERHLKKLKQKVSCFKSVRWDLSELLN